MQSSSLFVLLALVALFSLSSASTAVTSATGVSSSTGAVSTGKATATYSTTGGLSSSSASYIATSSAGFATGSYSVVFTADLPGNVNPNATYNTSSPLIQNLTTDIGTYLASTQTGVSASSVIAATTITAINGNPVSNTGMRRLLSTNAASITFVIAPVAGSSFNVANAATTFAQTASSGTLTLPTTGATVPVQSVPTPQNVGYMPPQSSSGQGSTGGAASTASAALSIVAVAAGLALLL